MTKIRLLSSGEVSEEAIHLAAIQWIRAYPKIAKLIIHIPNEGPRSRRYGKLLKDMGLRAGVCDLFIAIANHGFHGAWIEIKSRKGVLSNTQQLFYRRHATAKLLYRSLLFH